jgi:hypothetical protein
MKLTASALQTPPRVHRYREIFAQQKHDPMGYCVGMRPQDHVKKENERGIRRSKAAQSFFQNWPLVLSIISPGLLASLRTKIGGSCTRGYATYVHNKRAKHWISSTLDCVR